ncbi:MAG: hypothetical protein IK115_05030 [Lachnospiraceae bacterium]|nr:hypothetical protein [Lachnospiraceae bacterium]
MREELYINKEIPAYMTLEAVIIIPFCLIGTVLILWTGILLYDRMASDYALGVATIQAARNAEADNDEILQAAQEKAEELLTGRLVMAGEPTLRISVDGVSVTAELEGYLKTPPLPIPGSAEFDLPWSFKSKKSSPRLKESSIVRTLRRMTGG